MVRFIIFDKSMRPIPNEKFTFQYGQIYYKYKAIIFFRLQNDLHSNMVRFIMKKKKYS